MKPHKYLRLLDLHEQVLFDKWAHIAYPVLSYRSSPSNLNTDLKETIYFGIEQVLRREL